MAATPPHLRHTICFLSDFFFPNMGGVEMHIWYLSQCLIRLGHKVIVITHAYGRRQGIRYMTGGLKVYYLPLAVPYDQVIFPTLYAFFPLFRNILIREGVSLVHGHQSTSSLTNECILYARTMGYPVCYTEHSLFGLDDAASMLINKVLEVILSDVDHVICVSEACRRNLILRTLIHPKYVSKITNAVDGSKFIPDPSKRYPRDTVNIVLLSRLVHRKGIALLALVIPMICDRFSHVHFIIGGDGPLRVLLDRMCERHSLHHRVELLGTVAHSDVRDVLVRGHIFLNCSLTESFCMALLEAASCGLLVVSTEVGGIPEVLPAPMVILAKPEPAAVVEAIACALARTAAHGCTTANAHEMHQSLRGLYSWPEIARQTERVYDAVAEMRKRDGPQRDYLTPRLARYAAAGPLAGLIACFLAASLYVLWCACEVCAPAAEIERCPPDLPWGSSVELSAASSAGAGLGVGVGAGAGAGAGAGIWVGRREEVGNPKEYLESTLSVCVRNPNPTPVPSPNPSPSPHLCLRACGPSPAAHC